MKYLTVAAIFTIIFISEVLTSDVLRWRSSGISQSPSHLESDSGKPIVVDGSVPYQVSIKILNAIATPVINYLCLVHNLPEKRKITNAIFCRIYKKGKPNCQNIGDLMTFSDGLTFSALYDPQTGANITTNWSKLKPSDLPDISGLYYCEFSNDRSTIKSAVMDIQDFMIISKAISGSNKMTVTPLEPITPARLPLTIQCSGVDADALPEDANFNIPSPITWKLCQIESPSDSAVCSRAAIDGKPIISSLDMVFSGYRANVNGSLTIFSLREDTTNKYVILCFNPIDMTEYHSIFGGLDSSDLGVTGIIIDGRSKYYGPPVATGPLIQEIHIREGRRSLPYILLAEYRAEYSSIKHKWTKNGLALPVSTIDSHYEYYLGLPTDTVIHRHMAGEYRLHITYRDLENYLVFTFNVVILYPPSLKTDFLPEEYVMESGKLATSCLFENANNVKVSINGAELDTSSEKELQNSWTREKSKLGLPKLSFTITPTPVNTSDTIEYRVRDIPRGYSHVVTFEAENSVGMARVSKFVLVIRSPEFTDTPNKYDYIDKPLQSANHSFVCSMDVAVRDEILASGMNITQSWYVGEEDVRFDKWNRLFTIENDTTLTLSDLSKKNELLQELRGELRNTTVTCVIEIFKVDNLRKVILYNSRNDATLELDEKLRARLVISDKILVAGASMNWLWAIIVAAILMFIIASLITCLCFRNKEGATYLVDEQERAQGNDPEKEIQEKEIFHTYERIEDMESGSRLSYGNDSVGVQSEGDKDVEMYELDPGKFNEEGSFIYNYTQSNTGALKPPMNPYSNPHA